MVVDCYKVDGECCTTDQARNQEGRNYHLFHPGATTHSNKEIEIKNINDFISINSVVSFYYLKTFVYQKALIREFHTSFLTTQ